MRVYTDITSYFICYEGWPFTHMWEVIARQHHFIKRGLCILFDPATLFNLYQTRRVGCNICVC
jgi:hypothetical protein